MAGITGEAVIKNPCQLADTATMKIQNCSSRRHSQLSGSRTQSMSTDSRSNFILKCWKCKLAPGEQQNTLSPAVAAVVMTDYPMKMKDEQEDPTTYSLCKSAQHEVSSTQR